MTDCCFDNSHTKIQCLCTLLGNSALTALGTYVAHCKHWLSNPGSNVQNRKSQFVGINTSALLPPPGTSLSIWLVLQHKASKRVRPTAWVLPLRKRGDWCLGLYSQFQGTHPGLCLLDLANHFPKSACYLGEHKSNNLFNTMQNKITALQLTFPLYSTLCLCFCTQANGGTGWC